MNYFYITLIFIGIAVPGAILFAGWWNARHGLDDSGRPLGRLE